MKHKLVIHFVLVPQILLGIEYARCYRGIYLHIPFCRIMIAFWAK